GRRKAGFYQCQFPDRSAGSNPSHPSGRRICEGGRGVCGNEGGDRKVIGGEIGKVSGQWSVRCACECLWSLPYEQVQLRTCSNGIVFIHPCPQNPARCFAENQFCF